MDQSCPVVHKSRRPQARLQTAKLFCNNCVLGKKRMVAQAVAEMAELMTPTFYLNLVINTTVKVDPNLATITMGPYAGVTLFTPMQYRYVSRNFATQQSRNLATQQSRNLATQQSRNLTTQQSRNLATQQSRKLATQQSEL
jgi:hypothetical protein